MKNRFEKLCKVIMEDIKKSSKKHIIKESSDWDNWPSFVDPSLVQKKQDKYGRNYTAWKEGLTLRELLDAPGGKKNVQAFAIWCLQHDYYDGDNVEPDEIVEHLVDTALDEEDRNPDLDELQDILQQAEDDYLDEAGNNMWNAIQNNKEAFKKIIEANKDNKLALAKVLKFAQQEFYPDHIEDECELSDEYFWKECGCDIPEGVELIQTCEGSWGWDNWYDRENCYGPMVEKIIEELGIDI